MEFGLTQELGLERERERVCADLPKNAVMIAIDDTVLVMLKSIID